MRENYGEVFAQQTSEDMITCPQCKFTFKPEAKTNKQNAYLHFMFSIIAEETGNTLAYIKTWCKEEFGFYEWVYNDKNTTGFKVYESCGTMTNARLSQFIDYVFMWANSNDIRILSPEEFYNNG